MACGGTKRPDTVDDANPQKWEDTPARWVPVPKPRTNFGSGDIPRRNQSVAELRANFMDRQRSHSTSRVPSTPESVQECRQITGIVVQNRPQVHPRMKRPPLLPKPQILRPAAAHNKHPPVPLATATKKGSTAPPRKRSQIPTSKESDKESGNHISATGKSVQLMSSVLKMSAEIASRGVTEVLKGLHEEVFREYYVQHGSPMISLDKEFRTDFEDQYIPLCQAVVRRVQKLVRSLDLSSVDQCQLQQTQKQLEEKQVVFSVFGFNNSGKSTLLNAMLFDVLLPIYGTNETSVKVSIRHDGRRHQGPCPCGELEPSCQECPKLICEDGREMSGGKAIVRALQDVNQRVRQHSSTGDNAGLVHKIEEYTILANVPVLSRVPLPWVACLVDSPGFGDAVVGINQLAEAALKTSSAYLCVLDYDHLQNLSDTECFKLMHEKDRDIFSKKCCRLLIVVTKFDRYYTEGLSDYDQISEGQIKKIVCTRVKEATSIEEFPEENVIVASGKWALLARRLQARLECVEQRDVQKLKKTARKWLEDYIDQHPHGQAEDARAVTDSLPPQVIARKLEEASGIKQVEDRVRAKAAHCFTIWVKTISQSCHSYLEQAGSEIEKAMEPLIQTIHARERKYEHYTRYHTKMHTQYKEWQSSVTTGKDSPVYQEFDHAFIEDIQIPAQSCIEGARKLVEEFQNQCIGKTTRGNYMQHMFQEDVKILLESASKELEQSLSIARFEHMHALKTNKAQAIGKQDTLMRKYALKVCHREEDSDSDSEISEESGMYEENGASLHEDEQKVSGLEETLHNVLEPNPPRLQDLHDQVKLPSLSASIWTRFKMFLSSLFTSVDQTGILAEQPLTKKDLAQPLGQLEDVVTYGCKQYLREIRPLIVEHFHNDYCTRVEVCARNIRADFKERMQHQRGKMKKLKQEVDSSRRQVRTLTTHQIHIENLREHFVMKMRDFYCQHSILHD